MLSVDVIIPSRGHADYLGQAIDSVLGQRLAESVDLRVIVVADGCPDSYRVSQWFTRLHPVTSLLLTEPVGCYRAINTGLAESGGDWVTFCGADDKFENDRIMSLLDIATPLGWRAVANTWHRKMSAAGTPAKLGSEALGGVFMYSREMLDKLGGFKDWPCSADTDMYNRAIEAGGIRAIHKKPTYLYRQHGEQITKRAATAFGAPLRLAYQSAASHVEDIHVKLATGCVKERTD